VWNPEEKGGVDTSEYLGLFLDESRESLQTLNASLLELERDPADTASLAVIFRVAHSLKGMSATMGFEAMARLTHRMEEVLAAMRDGGAPVSAAITDALFACLDTLQEMVDRVAAGDRREVDASALIDRLAGTAAPAAAPATAAAQAAVTATPPAAGQGLGEYDRMVVADAHERGLAVLRVAVTFDEGCRLPGARAFMVAQDLESAGDLIKCEPSAERIEAGEVDGGVTFWIAADGGSDPDQIRARALAVSEVASCEVQRVEAAPGRAPERAPERLAASPEPRAARAASTVRVGTDRLDALMNLMGEMVIQRTRLAQLAGEHGLGDLRAAVEDLTRVTNDLQSLIMQVRMMPVEAVFMRFPRMVRDLAGTLGKRVDLVISGEQTELDRTVIDGLGDPLVHMLRNAVDHGLETPQEREAAGKDAVGTIHLSARHAGSSVVIEVREDGRGMDPAALRALVVRKGLMDADRADALSDEQALELVFLPGFSTVPQATAVSGRGVGMDAVRSAIAELHGEIAIASVIGQGSSFTIRLPLTLAIIQALLVTAGTDVTGDAGQVWAIPLEVIEETVIVGSGQTRPVGGRPCMVLRDGIVPLVWLRDCLHAGGPRRSGDDGPIEVVVVRSGSSRLGLVVDGLTGKQDVVIKRLPGFLGDVSGVAGATILGDGSVALIVDVAALSPGAARSIE